MRAFDVLTPAGIPESSDSSHELLPNLFTAQAQRDGGVSAVSRTSPCISREPETHSFLASDCGEGPSLVCW